MLTPNNSSRSLCSDCGSAAHLSRRALFRAAGLGSLAWLTPLAHHLALADEKMRRREPAKSVILLWLQGGPSQLETFDPHPGTRIAAGSQDIPTAVRGIRLAEGFEKLAAEMQDVSLVRSVVSKEGDHERAMYNMKTGYRPDPTLIHPSVGAIVCHALPVAGAEIPRHISVLPGPWAGRGGILGEQYDAFRVDDPTRRLPDIAPRVSDARFGQRLEDVAVVDRAFARGRLRGLEKEKTFHQVVTSQAVKMMSSQQLDAFDMARVEPRLRAEFGDTPFGRGCLAAARLIECGVRCVEVTLSGWDSHVNNHEAQRKQVKILDPAIAALLRQLRQRGLLRHTVVVCGGEFGRTPTMNPAGGRDHWPHGFSVALAGGGLRGGQVVGATDPEGGRQVERAVAIADLHTTVLRALGIDPRREIVTPAGRPVRYADGKPIGELLTR